MKFEWSKILETILVGFWATLGGTFGNYLDPTDFILIAFFSALCGFFGLIISHLMLNLIKNEKITLFKERFIGKENLKPALSTAIVFILSVIFYRITYKWLHSGENNTIFLTWYLLLNLFGTINWIILAQTRFFKEVNNVVLEWFVYIIVVSSFFCILSLIFVMVIGGLLMLFSIIFLSSFRINYDSQFILNAAFLVTHIYFIYYCNTVAIYKRTKPAVTEK